MRPAQAERGIMSSGSTVRSEGGLAGILAALWSQVSAGISKLATNRTRGLRLCESLSLGEKRMIAIVECDHQRFLLAATPQNISLLQSLGPAQMNEPQGKSD